MMTGHNDGAAGDGVWGGTIPGFDAGFWVRHYFEAVAADAFNTVSYLPAGPNTMCSFIRSTSNVQRIRA